jgi:hypothetical protein
MLKGIVSGAEKDITRIPMKSGNEYKEGWEIRDNQDRLIWGREDELQAATGTLPFKGYGLPLKVKSLIGNTQQTGTPTPDAPIMPTFCGVRTGNLWAIAPNAKIGYNQDVGSDVSGSAGELRVSASDDGMILTSNSSWEGTAWKIQVEAGKTYYLSFDSVSKNLRVTIYTVDGNNKVTRKISNYTNNFPKNKELTILDNEQYIVISISLNIITTAEIVEPMVTTDVVPYEPYGYKIPFTCAGQTVPVYLGQTQTVRRVKKLVLTGDELWQKSGAYKGSFYAQLIKNWLSLSYAAYCTHAAHVPTLSLYEKGKMVFNGGLVGNCNLWFNQFDENTTVADFKAYLAAQYAAGTPVTVWYVLAEPETAIVNEPLAKIGDYADELNDTVATLPEIPTTTGQNTLTVDTTLAPSSLIISVHAKKIHYGFKIDKSVDDSEDAVIYTHDAITMTPAHMDFTNDIFDYGSWGNAFFVRDCYPVALNLDGTEAYRLDPDDYTKKMDGTPSDIFYELLTEEPSDWSTQWKQYYTKSGDEYVLNSQSTAPTFAIDTYYKLTYTSSFAGNFMMAFPKVWFYRHEDSQYNYIEISNHKLSDDWKCYAHINANGQEVDFIYLPLFKGVIKDSKLRSLPGQIPQGGTTATAEANAATALGSRWQIWDHSSVECLNDLLTLMSKSIDSQGRFGQGRSAGYDSRDTVTYGKLQTGTLINKGKFHGYSATTKEVKIFGLEGFWANRFDRLQGMLLVDNVWKIKMTPPYDLTGTDFVTLSNAEVPSQNGYLSKVQTSEYGSIPASVVGGASNKYFKDRFYKAATGSRVAIRGGNCNVGVSAGCRCVSVSHADSYSNWDIGASPVYK